MPVVVSVVGWLIRESLLQWARGPLGPVGLKILLELRSAIQPRTGIWLGEPPALGYYAWNGTLCPLLRAPRPPSWYPHSTVSHSYPFNASLLIIKLTVAPERYLSEPSNVEFASKPWSCFLVKPMGCGPFEDARSLAER